MKRLPILIPLCVILGLSSQASAKKRSHHRHPGIATPTASDSGERAGEEAPKGQSPEEKPPEERSPQEAPPAATDDGKPDTKRPALDFDFFAGQPGSTGEADEGARTNAIEAQERTRRWMLKTHQTLGITTWLSMVATVTIGQLNYNELWGGGGGSNKWQTPHRALVISTSALFAATATFAILAPTPHKKPLQFDTGLVHRIAVIGATLGMVAEGVLGWITTHQADAGNPHNLQAMARAHQIVGYTTLGFLTVAGTVWLF